MSVVESLMEDLYNVKSIDTSLIESRGKIGQISEREKFHAAKQILFGLAILYVFTVIAFLLHPVSGRKLLDIITVTFPPLATLILAAYFKNN